MLTKYSIKKPMTVFVAVILSLMLGAVAFTNLQTDFLPHMEMPYVVIVTVCPGFTPEKAEKLVAKPIESTMSTVNGVENVRSQSSGNICMVSVEFSYKTNMDTAMIELNNRLASVSSSFEEGVGTPFMLQVDPDMLPVYAASVSKKGADLKELTRLTDDIAVPALERTDGVASVTPVGTLMNRIEITLNQDKIDSVNEKIIAWSDSQAASAYKEINAGKKALSAAKKELDARKLSSSLKIAKAGVALADGKDALLAGAAAMESSEAQIGQILKLLDLLEPALKPPADPEAMDAAAGEAASMLLALADKLKTGGSVLGDMAGRLEKADPAEIDWDALEDMLKGDTEALKAAEQIRRYLSDTAGPEGSLTLLMKDLSEKMTKNSDNMNGFAEQLKAMNPGTVWSSLAASVSELRRNMEQAEDALPEQKKELQQKLNELSEQQAKVEQGKIILATELASAEQKIQSSEDKLKLGEAQIKESLDKAASRAGLSSLLDQKMLKALIAAQNFSMPAGYLEDGDSKFSVKVGDALKSPDDLKTLPLFVSDEKDIGTVTLLDVADIVMKDNSEGRFAKVNGSDGVLLIMQKQSIASTNVVSKELRKTVGRLEKENPGLEINAMMDQGIYIDVVIRSVLQALIIGGILAVLILFVFLKSVKATLVVAFSIPISLMLSVVLMYFSGVSVNIISLAGLALCVGMLVDNSIVVIENTYRLRTLGVPSGKAALSGAEQMAGAITASTLTTVCVFLPIVFTKGISRQLFTDMGLTIAYSLLSSLLIALSLVPVLSATMLRNMKTRAKDSLSGLKDFYGRALSFCLRKKWIPIGLSLALLIVSIFGATKLGTAFIPESAADQLMMTVSLPEGEEVTTEKLRQRSLEVMDALCRLDNVQAVGVYDMPEGSVMPMNREKSLTVYIVMSEKKSKSAKKVMDDIRRKAAAVPNCKTVLSQGMNMMSFLEKGVEIKIRGENIGTLRELSEKAAGLLSKTAGLENIDDGFGDTAPEINILVDKEKAIADQITVATVFQQVAGAIQNSFSVTSLDTEEGNIDIRLCRAEEQRLTYEALQDYPISYKDMMTGEMKSVPLGDIAQISMGENLSAIIRENLSRVVSVKAHLKNGYNIGLISRGLEKELKRIHVPKGYSMSIEGENKMINTALHDVGFMLILAVILIYLIMVAEFQSLTGPFIVMFTIPLAFTGGLFALWMFGFELSVISVLGFLVLAGVVVNNGIVFVDTFIRMQRSGTPRREALIETGKMRLRPILMTAVTTVLGLTSLALGFGTGADMLQPLAVVVVFGLTYATLLTLFVVPALCDGIFMRKPVRDIDIE